MSKRTNLSAWLFMLVFLLAMVGTTFAEPLLFPFQVGQQYEFHKWDSDDPVNEWTVLWEVESQIIIGSFDYFQIREWNYDNDGTFDDFPYVRSTEGELYIYGSPDNLDFQKADLGTSWSYYEPDTSGMNYKYIEIVAIEPVTVPYGTFTTAYKHRKCLCEFPDGSGNKSPYWYEWIVPGKNSDLFPCMSATNGYITVSEQRYCYHTELLSFLSRRENFGNSERRENEKGNTLLFHDVSGMFCFPLLPASCNGHYPCCRVQYE